MQNKKFVLKSKYKPAGDQPKAIKALTQSIAAGNRDQTLFGVTGSGKTFSVANVIQKMQMPTLVIAHNKTLAAQLAQEYKEFFPENAVHYFVSYYDFYQPEAYMPVTDTYIEKEAMVNEEIDRLRHASTQAILSRSDVIIVATVSCIYGLGSPVEYEKVNFKIIKGSALDRKTCVRRMISMHFKRTTADLKPGFFRAVGNAIEIVPSSEREVVRIEFDGSVVASIATYDPITREVVSDKLEYYFLFPAKHFITEPGMVKVALKSIQKELDNRLAELDREGKILEKERLKRRTRYDIAMIREVGYCNGIENYSRHFSNLLEGEPPDSLLSYFRKAGDRNSNGGDSNGGFLTVIDESHVTVPQIGGMYAGDQSRKQSLVEHGFRLPSAKDNRPLTFPEFRERTGITVYTSATPGVFEKENSSVIAEQVIRPTGLIDPELSVFPVRSGSSYSGQVQHFIKEALAVIKGGGRVIATTLTKKMAEDLSVFLKEKNIKSEYVHSGIKTIERIEILTNFRKGVFDCLVGVNLLREGLDLPEVEFIGILDADKEGFLRSETALIQTIGRAARNVKGRVFLYADTVTNSMTKAITETNRRRTLQTKFNKENNITPKTIIKKIQDITEDLRHERQQAINNLLLLEADKIKKNPLGLIRQKEKEMNSAVKILDFETAALIRDEIRLLESTLVSKIKKTHKNK